MPGAVRLTSLLQADPIPYGPSTWSARQWVGLGVYSLLFVLFVYLVYRLARPVLDSEVDRPTPSEEPPASGRP